MLLISGACALLRNGRTDLLLLTLVPIAAVLIAAVSGKWVVETRLMLFLAPIVAVLIASGVEWFAETIPGFGTPDF